MFFGNLNGFEHTFTDCNTRHHDDKFLREKLYKYLSVAEEYLRDILYKNIEYTGSNILMYKRDYSFKHLLFRDEYKYSFYFLSQILLR